MSLRQRLADDMKAAMKGGERDRLAVIRLILAAIKQREVDERIDITDAVVVAVLEKMLKQRRDAVAQYEAAGREDLAARERFEIEVIQTYLPAPMTAEELDAAVDKAIAEAGAQGPADMGKVMARLKPALAGRADMTEVAARVRARLAAGG
ncbi:MAG: hypothetical protein KatS3mg126_0149 [Lysobacteraceae bacterium]|nr:MAG: hypothetical protein KatS3mg126_0149 [Xanthomonadaceae bacterium]